MEKEVETYKVVYNKITKLFYVDGNTTKWCSEATRWDDWGYKDDDEILDGFDDDELENLVVLKVKVTYEIVDE